MKCGIDAELKGRILFNKIFLIFLVYIVFAITNYEANFSVDYSSYIWVLDSDNVHSSVFGKEYIVEFFRYTGLGVDIFYGSLILFGFVCIWALAANLGKGNYLVLWFVTLGVTLILMPYSSNAVRQFAASAAAALIFVFAVNDKNCSRTTAILFLCVTAVILHKSVLLFLPFVLAVNSFMIRGVRVWLLSLAAMIGLYLALENVEAVVRVFGYSYYLQGQYQFKTASISSVAFNIPVYGLAVWYATKHKEFFAPVVVSLVMYVLQFEYGFFARANMVFKVLIFALAFAKIGGIVGGVHRHREFLPFGFIAITFCIMCLNIYRSAWVGL